jgi:diguanylate cyclase (GGDEF)-like protein
MSSFSVPGLAVPRWRSATAWPLFRWAAFGLAALAIFGAADTELETRDRAAALAAAAAAAGPTAVSYGMLLQSEIEKQRLVPYILANDPDVIAALVPGPHQGAAALQAARAALDQKLLLLCTGTTAGVIYVLDKTGLSVAASNFNEKDSFVGTNYAFRPYYVITRARGDDEYFAAGIISHLPGLFVAHRVMWDGQFVGIVVVKVQFETLESTWAKLGDDVFVVDHNGIVTITDRPDWRYHSFGPLPQAVRQTLLETGQFGHAALTPLPLTPLGDGRVAMPDGESFVPVTAQIPTKDWNLVLLQNVDADLQAADRGALRVALLVTLLAVGAGVIVRGQLRHYFLVKAKNEEIRQLANTDALTLLPNRRAFEAALEEQCRGCAATKSPLAAVMVDVDHFKLFNDCYGHPAGDECLRAVAKLLRAAARRSGDMAARYGGEEFVLLLPNADLAGAVLVAEEVHAAIREMRMPHAKSATSGIVTVSIGVASLVPESAADAERLISAADRALYEAKNRGRDRVAVG